MSSSDWYYLGGLTGTQFANGGHRALWQPTMTAIANTANDVANFAGQSQVYYTLQAQTYAAMLALTGGSMGVGSEGLDVPLTVFLGSAAFVDIEQVAAGRPVTQNSSYQIVPADFWTTLLRATSGTPTYTLPLWSDMPANVPPLPGINRSGASITIARSGSDTINAAATSVTVPNGSSFDIWKDDSAGLWEVRVYA